MIKFTEFAGKKGKYFFGSVKVGERGQIVIPHRAREIFNINSKNDVQIFGDLDKGLGIAINLDIDEEALKLNEQYFGTSIVGERGQIVIPQKARELFNLTTGDLLLVFGDKKKGLGIVKSSKLKNFAIKLFQAFGGIQGMQLKDNNDLNEEINKKGENNEE